MTQLALSDQYFVLKFDQQTKVLYLFCLLPSQVFYGRWLIDGYPSVVLFDIGSGAQYVDHWKKDLFDLSRIGIPWTDKESNDAVIFGNLCSWFISDVSSKTP